MLTMAVATLDKIRLIGRMMVLTRHDRWSRATLLKYQARRLEHLRRFAVDHSPFYRRFHHGLESAALLATASRHKGSADARVRRSGHHARASGWIGFGILPPRCR